MPDPHLSKVADQLQQLRTAFSRLPPKHHSAGSTYPFENFVIDDEWLELTGSVQGSVNHTLEVAFGSRHNGGPIEFKSHGPDLAAVVDVLSAHITGEGGENPILIKWIVDLHRAAVHAAEQDPSEDSKKRERKPSAKQEIINQEESTNANKKKKKAAAKARTKKAKERTEEDFLWDPLDLRPAKRNDSTVGRKPDPLLDKLTEFVEAISDPEVKHWRCIAHSSGCQHSQADPRSSLRVFSHAVDCSFLDPELVQRAAEASISRSLGAQIEALNAVETASKGKDDPQPSVYAEARATGREKRSLNFNHLVLQAVCGLSLPPSILDTKHWRSLIDFLDPYLDRKSGSHMAHALIPAEAARVRQLSIKALQKHRNLTLTFDGATSRRNQSIYTIHATTPDTRPVYPAQRVDEYGAELEADARVWKTYVKESDEFDQDLVEGWNRQITGRHSQQVVLMLYLFPSLTSINARCTVFAALFSAISTTFVLESSKQLQEDPADATAQTLETISQTLLLIAQGNQSLLPRSTSLADTLQDDEFAPNWIAVCINVLWFLSLALSVAASLIAMLAKEWCYLFMSGRTGQPCLQARRRQQRWDAMVMWKMPELLMFLPSLMHLSLFLFAVGLSIYLWEMHFGVALPVILVTLSVMSVYLASSILPFLYEFCPYTTATSRFIKGIYDTFLRTTTTNGNSIIPQDIITSRALRWLIETCEDPRSVDIALQAIAGAEETLPLEPLKECNAPLMISRRLTAGKCAYQDSSGASASEAKPRSCDPEELWIKVRKLQNSTERELDVHLTNQELYLTEDNLLALQIGTSAFSYCLQVLDIAPQNRSYELIDWAVELLEKTDPIELHDAARISFITGTQMLIACSLIHCESPLAARFVLRLMEADLSPKYLGVFLTLFALSRNDYLGWIVPAPLDSVARATRAIDAVAYYTPILDQLDDETADTLIDFGLLELLSGSSSYNLLDRDFEQIRAMFIWVARDQGAQIHTLPTKFDIRRHAMNIISTELETLDGQQASYSIAIGSPPERIYGFVVESFFRAPSLFLEDCWALMGDFPIPILSQDLARAMDDREILRLLLGALDSQVPDQRVFAISQLALLIKLVTCDAKGGFIAKEWKAIIAETFRYEELCKPLEQLKRIGEGLVRAFRDIYEEDPQWSYYEYCSRVVDYVS
ncbi:transmembrane protein, putative, partial [Rhizoctonia solani AG-3 Rhs1AP]